MIIRKKILKEVYKKRKPSAHKYDFGHLLIIGGSKMYSGSPALAGLAAYRTGVDIVTIAAPERSANIIAGFSPDLITYPLKGDYVNQKHLKDILRLAKNKDAIVIGGGIERHKQTSSAIVSFLRKIRLPCVIDADAIHSVAKQKNVLKKYFVLTPHEKEFYDLTGKNPRGKKLNERIILVKKAAAKLKAIILLKGNIDIISDGKEVILNKTGNPYMTKGGTGDTLAGIVGSLLAQGVKPIIAAAAAAYINGKAGEIASKNKKQALMATDLINSIHKLF
ncbi:MAG: NAD(P)H-hydrate dehydratase [Nanoarchaeota archaeon]|nr:NAD(P)H-hydrate dehydratase [Nanoarchaeota archaeon]MCG2718226.1 NAD(P)H-hydrate dehydratase [Nanoarchaeota archaeon]